MDNIEIVKLLLSKQNIDVNAKYVTNKLYINSIKDQIFLIVF